MSLNENLSRAAIKKGQDNSSVLAQITKQIVPTTGKVDTRFFGASWDGGSSPTLTRTGSAVGLVAAAAVGTALAVNNFDAMPIWGEMEDVADAYGNLFVCIPKFYWRITADGAARSWEVSKYKHPGFSLPWCFWDFANEKELPYVLVGKYKASLSTDSLRLESKPGKSPLVSKNIVEFRTLANANNANGQAGYQQLDIHTYAILRTLMRIEFATLDLQTVMQGLAAGQWSTSHLATVAGTGVNQIVVSNATAANYVVGQCIDIDTAAGSMGDRAIAKDRQITAINVYDESNKAMVFDGAAVNIATTNVVRNCGQRTGSADTVNASAGTLVSNSDGKRPAIWRGIESVYGDLWQWVDGVNINERQAWVCNNPAQYASNVFAAPYQQLAYPNGGSDGWVTAMGYDSAHPEAEFATAVGGSSSTHYADYYSQTAGQRVARVGGYWFDGSGCGPGYWALGSSAAGVGVGFGGRLLKKPL